LKCPECKTENIQGSRYCKKCGKKLINSEDISVQIEKKIEKVAKEFGEAADRLGRKLEHGVNKSGNSFNQWNDKVFGIFGPLVWSFLALIIIRIFIFGMEAIEDDFVVAGVIGSVLYGYLLIIFTSILIGTYNTYLLRKYKKHYQLISPCISSICFIIGLWILSKIFSAIDAEIDFSILKLLASFIETYLILIFIAAILISYGAMLLSSPFNKKRTA